MWERACRFIGRNSEDHGNETDISIPGLQHKLIPYQYYGVFLMLSWFKDGRNGGILADSVGLGKVSKISLLFRFLVESNLALM